MNWTWANRVPTLWCACYRADMNSAPRSSFSLSSPSIGALEAPGSSKTSCQAPAHTCTSLKHECEGLKGYLALKQTLRKPRSCWHLFGYSQRTLMLLPGDASGRTTRRQCWRWSSLEPWSWGTMPAGLLWTSSLNYPTIVWAYEMPKTSYM